jgi:hypothetical protein
MGTVATPVLDLDPLLADIRSRRRVPLLRSPERRWRAKDTQNLRRLIEGTFLGLLEKNREKILWVSGPEHVLHTRSHQLGGDMLRSGALTLTPQLLEEGDWSAQLSFAPTETLGLRKHRILAVVLTYRLRDDRLGINFYDTAFIGSIVYRVPRRGIHAGCPKVEVTAAHEAGHTQLYSPTRNESNQLFMNGIMNVIIGCRGRGFIIQD